MALRISNTPRRYCARIARSRLARNLEHSTDRRNGFRALSTNEATTDSTQQASQVESIRLTQEGDKLKVEYLVSLAQNSRVWLPSTCVSEDLKRNYASGWWTACRDGDVQALQQYMDCCAETMIHTRDSKDRSPLHFLAGRGDTEVICSLLDVGADVNSQDADGYTPLHLAAGYMQLESLQSLLDAGADADIEDGTGRSPQSLVRTLLNSTPVTTTMYSRRIALESMLRAIEDHIYEEVVPARIVNKRNSNGYDEYLVEWLDDFEETWIPEVEIADDIIFDYENDIERVVGTVVHDDSKDPKSRQLIEIRRFFHGVEDIS